MKRPQDSDIFGTKSIRTIPKIGNDQKIDPNAQFQARMNRQYDDYAKKINPNYREITKLQNNFTSVNEKADFDENYHHYRKQADMRSSVFGQTDQSMESSRVTNSSRLIQRMVPKHASQQEVSYTFGRKETLKREMDDLPENSTQIKGNGSTIFGFDQKDQHNNPNKLSKLIPYQMEWDQHDSIRYRDGETQKVEDKPLLVDSPEDLIESQSVVMCEGVEKENNEIISNIEQLANQFQSKVGFKKAKRDNSKDKKIKSDQDKVTNNQKRVEISILKGWSPKIMEDLSKYCRINGTKILSINFQEGGKGTLALDRSKRWEVVTDWLRRDAKLKIRVQN